jgi:hypothetical protein
MGDVEIPPGIMPVFLTMTTQEMFKVVSGEDVTPEMPYKRVNIAAILKDINFRGVISDWQPAKKEIETYATELPKEEGDDPATTAHILVVMDDDTVYGQNYFFCSTEAKAEEIIAQYAAKAAEESAEAEAGAVEEEEPRPKEIMDPDLVNRPWVEWTPPVEGEGEEADAERQKQKDSYITTSMEIESAIIKESGPRLRYAFSRKRGDFRQGGKFYDVDNAESEDYKQYRDPQFKENPEQPGVFGTRYLLRNSATSCVPLTTESSAQTARFRLVNSMVQYAPIVQQTDDDSKKKEDAELVEMFERVMPLVEDALSSNETVQLFVEDMTRLGDEETLGNTSDNAIKEYTSPFTDIDFSKNKIISAIDWMPDAKGMVAVACTERASLEDQVEMDGKVRTSHILIWNFKDPIHPQLVLESPYDIHTFRFNPKNSDTLVAGCASGQILVFDLGPAKERVAKRDKASGGGNGAGDGGGGGKDEKMTIKHVLSSSIESSHKRAVADIKWLAADREIETRPKNAGHVLATPTTTDGVSQQLISVAADGLVLFWDLRVKKEDKSGGFLWTPVWRVHLSSPDVGGELCGLQCSLRRQSTLSPPAAKAPAEGEGEGEGEEEEDKAPAVEDNEWKSEFAVGTEDGQLVHGTWVLPEEEGALFVKSTVLAHYGPTVAVERSPFFEECVLTVGDWAFSIFMAAAQQPVVKSCFAHTYLTCGRFSPTRPGVILTARADGCLDVWDLCDRTHEPSLQVRGWGLRGRGAGVLGFWGWGCMN